MTKEEFKQTFKEILKEQAEAVLGENHEGRNFLREMVQEIIITEIRNSLGFRNLISDIYTKELENFKPIIIRRLEKEIIDYPVGKHSDDVYREAVKQEWDNLVDIIKEKLKKLKIDDGVLYDKIIDRLLK